MSRLAIVGAAPANRKSIPLALMLRRRRSRRLEARGRTPEGGANGFLVLRDARTKVGFARLWLFELPISGEPEIDAGSSG